MIISGRIVVRSVALQVVVWAPCANVPILLRAVRALYCWDTIHAWKRVFLLCRPTVADHCKYLYAMLSIH